MSSPPSSSKIISRQKHILNIKIRKSVIFQNFEKKWKVLITNSIPSEFIQIKLDSIMKIPYIIIINILMHYRLRLNITNYLQRMQPTLAVKLHIREPLYTTRLQCHHQAGTFFFLLIVFLPSSLTIYFVFTKIKTGIHNTSGCVSM